MNSSSLGIILGITALFFNGFMNFFGKIPAQKLGVNRMIFYRNLCNTLLLGLVLVSMYGETSFDPKYMGFAAILSLFGYLPMYFFYKAVAVGKLGVVSPVASGNMLVAVLLAIVFFGESLTTIQSLAIFIILMGIILISINFQEFKKSNIFELKSGVPYALLAAIGWGFWTVFVKIPVSHLGPYLTSFIVEAGAFIVAFFILLRSKDKFTTPEMKMFWYIIPLSLSLVIWSLAYYQGMKVANLSILVPLSSSSPLIVTILGRVFYKERLSRKHYLAILFIVAGIVLLST